MSQDNFSFKAEYYHAYTGGVSIFEDNDQFYCSNINNSPKDVLSDHDSAFASQVSEDERPAGAIIPAPGPVESVFHKQRYRVFSESRSATELSGARRVLAQEQRAIAPSEPSSVSEKTTDAGVAQLRSSYVKKLSGPKFLVRRGWYSAPEELVAAARSIDADWYTLTVNAPGQLHEAIRKQGCTTHGRKSPDLTWGWIAVSVQGQDHVHDHLHIVCTSREALKAIQKHYNGDRRASRISRVKLGVARPLGYLARNVARDKGEWVFSQPIKAARRNHLAGHELPNREADRMIKQFTDAFPAREQPPDAPEALLATTPAPGPSEATPARSSESENAIFIAVMAETERLEALRSRHAAADQPNAVQVEPKHVMTDDETDRLINDQVKQTAPGDHGHDSKLTKEKTRADLHVESANDRIYSCSDKDLKGYDQEASDYRAPFCIPDYVGYDSEHHSFCRGYCGDIRSQHSDHYEGLRVHPAFQRGIPGLRRSPSCLGTGPPGQGPPDRRPVLGALAESGQRPLRTKPDPVLRTPQPGHGSVPGQVAGSGPDPPLSRLIRKSRHGHSPTRKHLAGARQPSNRP